MKAVLLLALALFLISAPAPDSSTIAEMTAQFIVVEDQGALRAADTEQADTASAHHPSENDGEEPELRLYDLL